MEEPGAAADPRQNAARPTPRDGDTVNGTLMPNLRRPANSPTEKREAGTATATTTLATTAPAFHHQGHDDLSDVYFLVADFLRRATPCSRAASMLEEELHALGLLRTAVNWQGQEQPATYTDLHLRHRRLPPTQLVSLLRKSAAGTTDGLMRRQDVVASTSEERRSALDTLIHLWRNIRSNERKVQNITLLLEKINLRKQHMTDPDEVDLVAEHRGAKQLIELKAQLARDSHTSRSVWQRVEAWGLPRSVTTVTPTTNYFRHLRQRNVVGQSHRPPHAQSTSLLPLPSTPPTFVYSRYRKLKSLSGHLQLPVFCVTYDKSGKYIITGADDRLVKIWSALTGELLYTLHGHVGNITDMDIHPSNGLLVTSSDDKTARVWEIATGFSIAVLVGHTSDVNTSRFHPVENVVVTASDDGTCCMFRLPTVDGPTGFETKTETVQRLFKQQAYCRNIKPFVVLNHTNARLNRSSKVVSLAISPIGDVVVTGSQDGMARVWRIKTFLAEATPEVAATPSTDEVDAVVNSIPHQVEVSTANFVVQQRVVAAPEVPGAANPHWVNSTVVTEPIAVLNGHTQSITTLLFSHRGDAIATASMKDGTSRLWRWSKAKPYDKVSHTILRGPEMLLSARRATSELSTDQLVWTSDDSRLVTLHSRKPEVTGKWCQALRVWDPVACKPLRTLSHDTHGHANAVFAMDSHPTDSRILLTAGYDGRIVIWDIEVGRILRFFQNWESSINMDGCAILDVSFSPEGESFAATDRAGRLLLFGTGSGDAFQGTPTEQYFSNDYAPIDLDGNLNVADRATQVQPQLLPRSVLMDMGRNVYPHQPLHLMQPLSVQEYQANVALRRKQTSDTPYFNSIVDQDAHEPFVDANFVEEPVERPLVHRPTALANAYRLNGEAVKASELRRKRRQGPVDDPTDRDTSVLNDVLPSSEDDDEDFQVNDAAQVEEEEEEDDDMDDDDAGSEDDLDSDLVLDGNESRALRSQRRRSRQHDEEDENENDGGPARRRRRVRVARNAIVEEDDETKDDPPPSPHADAFVADPREEDLVVESSEGVTVSGNQRDKFDETKSYTQMFAQKSSIVCGFCGRGDQGGMFALPGALMGDFALVNGAQRVFVHDQCAISSPLSFFHDGSWYNVAKELRRGRLLKCFHCGQRGATIGCNTESCKITIHLPCGMVHGYNVDQVQYFCKTHAAKSGVAPPSSSSISPESFIRRMGHQYDRLYCQQSAVSHELALIPQVGDTLMYCPQGHAVFLRSFPSKFQAAFTSLPKPFAVLQCRVVDIQFTFPPVDRYPQQKRIVMQLVMDVVGLPSVYFGNQDDDTAVDVLDFGSFVPVNRSFVQDESEARPKWRFRVQHQPSECAEFLLLEQKFLSGFQAPRWEVGATVQMAYHTMDDHGMIQDTQMDTGKILEISPLDPAMPSPWECIVVQWENEDTPCRVSPWELEADQTHFGPPELPNRPALLQGLMSIRQLSVASGFNEAVPTSTPDYHITIANPMDLSLICQRVESSYYRHVDALLADVKLMVRNCEAYNVESSLIAQNARSVLTNIMTLLNQLFPAHEWLPALSLDDVRLDAGAELDTAATAASASIHAPVTVQPARHRPLKRELGGHFNANKRTTAEREQRVMLSMRLPIAQREAFQSIVAKGKLVECLTQVHTHAQAEDQYLIFAQPVTDDIAPGYSVIITRPMDFATMKAKIPQYPTLSAYYDDYMLVVENAMTYNQPGTLVFTEAKRMKAVLSKCFGRVLGGQKGKGKAKARRRYSDDDDDDSAESSDSSDGQVEEEDEASEDEASSTSESDEDDDDDDDDDGARQRRKPKAPIKQRGRKHSLD